MGNQHKCSKENETFGYAQRENTLLLCCVCFGRVYYYASVTDTEKKHANENDKIVIAIMVVVDSSICVRESRHSSS